MIDLIKCLFGFYGLFGNAFEGIYKIYPYRKKSVHLEGKQRVIKFKTSKCKFSHNSKCLYDKKLSCPSLAGYFFGRFPKITLRSDNCKMWVSKKVNNFI